MLSSRGERGGIHTEKLYEDGQLLVCVKPPFVSSQLAADGNDMVTLLREETGGEIYPVHRLDSLTTGLMVYAKTQRAAAFLSGEITAGRFEKEYTAEVHGRPSEDKGRYEDLLYRDAKKNKSFVVKRDRKGVKKAVLEYEVLDTRETPDGVFSTVRIRLLTGRTHQIRAQFASRGMPVAGDGKYGSHLNRRAIALTSSYLSFRHPESGERMRFSLKNDKEGRREE